jgi:chemotaxis signal transduction protein
MNPQEQAGPGETRELLLMRAGGRVFAVGADETGADAQACPRPTPLPHAPRAVLGVVCLRGRMHTVLDPLALVGESQGEEGAGREGEGTRPLVVALRGDEQLALAVEGVEGVVRVPAGALSPPQRPARPLRAALEHEGASLLVLDPAQLFDAAMRGTERRRPRTVNREP